MTEPPSLQPLGLTPSQTVGPYLGIGLPWLDGPDVIAADAVLPDGIKVIRIVGRLTDGAGAVVPDGMVEVWQADPDGQLRSSGIAGFRGFGRSDTDGDGRFFFRTLKPGPLPAEDGRTEAPHLDVSVFARGLVDRLVTRLYFPDETEANANDPVLADLTPPERAQLVARRQDDETLRFDICLQGPDQTPFFRL